MSLAKIGKPKNETEHNELKQKKTNTTATKQTKTNEANSRRKEANPKMKHKDTETKQ